MKALKLHWTGKIEVKEIPNELKALQVEVGGYIEEAGIFADVASLVNEEGRLIGLPPNLALPGIVGDVLFCGIRGDEFCDLTSEQIKYLKIIFKSERKKAL